MKTGPVADCRGRGRGQVSSAGERLDQRVLVGWALSVFLISLTLPLCGWVEATAVRKLEAAETTTAERRRGSNRHTEDYEQAQSGKVDLNYRMKIHQLKMKIFIFTLYLIAGQVCCSDVLVYSGGSIILFPDLQWDVNNTRYICRMEQTGCRNVIKDQTNSKSVTSGRFKMYSNVDGKFTVLIRELNPQDSAVYRFGVGNEKHKDIKLTVQSDSCCGGITKMKAHLGETATFKCSYPDEFKTNNKYLDKFGLSVKDIIKTGKEAEKEQKDRFSIFDDRSSKVFSVNISDVREDDGGVYLCGVWRKDTSVGYYSYFREVQLQVTEGPEGSVTTLHFHFDWQVKCQSIQEEASLYSLICSGM
ncbi:hypothetical protein MHYP_G00103920 [Metynnis hypsauchen]